METPLKVFRQSRGLIIAHVAKAIGIDPSYYRRVEIGEIRPSAEVAIRISEHFDGAVTRDQIIFPEYYPAKRARSKTELPEAV